jgi:predicted phage tail protein
MPMECNEPSHPRTTTTHQDIGLFGALLGKLGAKLVAKTAAKGIAMGAAAKGVALSMGTGLALDGAMNMLSPGNEQADYSYDPNTGTYISNDFSEDNKNNNNIIIVVVIAVVVFVLLMFMKRRRSYPRYY